MYINPPGNAFYFPPLDGSRLRRLATNLAAARDAADEYVWVYGEQCNWWAKAEMNEGHRTAQAKSVGKGRRWEDAMPGLTDVLRSAKDPDDAAWKQVAERKAKGRLTNLTRNGDFSKADADKTLLADWESWQDDSSTGTFSRNSTMRGGVANATRVKNGGMMQWHTVETGQKYALQALCKVEGAARANVVVRWKTDKGDWVRWDEDVALTAEQGVDGARYSGVVTVPKNAQRMVILLSVSQQTGAKDACWFDDVELYAVPAVSFPDEMVRR